MRKNPAYPCLSEHPQTEYYERLLRISEHGEWDGWLAFFLRGVREVADRSSNLIQQLGELQREHSSQVAEHVTSRFGRPMLDHVLRTAYTEAPTAAFAVGCTRPTARALLAQFEELGVLESIPCTRKPKVYRYPGVLRIFR